LTTNGTSPAVVVLDGLRVSAKAKASKAVTVAPGVLATAELEASFVTVWVFPAVGAATVVTMSKA
jgi:hypothetical protein